jgi:succinate dehydrogenase / fumarate reductase cytochrome b subunit
MYALSRFWQSTIGKKIVMAVTGIIGILFVIGHMSGNFLMFKGQGAMHDYALLLRTSMPLLWAIRLGLLAAVVLHAVAAYQLTMVSRAARPDAYAVRRPQVTTFAAKTIRWGGVLLLVFIVFHILHMTIGAVHPQFTHLDPYNNVRIGLANPAVAAFYILAMAALGLHLYHGGWAHARCGAPGGAAPQAHPVVGDRNHRGGRLHRHSRGVDGGAVPRSAGAAGTRRGIHHGRGGDALTCSN